MVIRVKRANSSRPMSRTVLSSGSRCSLSVAVWSLVGCLLFLHLYTLVHHTDVQNKEMHLGMSHRSLLRELEEVEEENIQMPPPRKRSPRAVKRKPKRPTNLIDEFLDESSQIRHIFFPDMETAVDPTKDAGNNSFFYYPGRIWVDTDGNPIQAHGGGILYDKKSKTYYWYGEYKDGPTYHAHKKGAARVDIIGVGCYSSKDLWMWKSEGIVLAAEENNETHDLHKSNVLERPKVIYNDKTGKYTMGNPCIGGNKIFRQTTFFAQSTFVLPLPDLPGSFIFMADRWNPADLRDSRYVWLPLIVGGASDQPLEYNFGFPLWSRVSIYWHKRWRVPYRWSE
ncbi:Galactan 1,3-beta-galactosidase [Olea europaea subsp. europaea]|uniref:Galactan 1,3-beta-galactosidase n=1 Tax=Olea europaea subsp. europaea TaxID=158383 RepID=A0A8S0RJD2_OLEEU|nr:Galactan 1,3-beta-galactosidase [Olea europaea subsp. europaea]